MSSLSRLTVPLRRTTAHGTSRGAAIGRLLILTLAGLALGYLVGLLIASLGEPGLHDERSLSDLFALLVALIPALSLVILVHELGHVAAGGIVGFRFHLLVIGPLIVRRERGGIVVGLNRDIALAGGLAAMLPTGSDHLRRRTAVMVAGGPLASIILSLLLLPLALSTSGASVGGVVIGELAVATAIASLAIGIVTLVPTRTSGFATDGARLRRLLRGGDEADADVASALLLAQSLAGVRPAVWSSRLLIDASAFAREPLQHALAHSYAYLAAIDRREIDEAREHLQLLVEILDELPETVGASIRYEVAYFVAMFEGESDAARAWLESAGGVRPLDQTSAHRARAAVFLAEGEYDMAVDEAELGIDAAIRSIDRGTAEAEEEWLRSIIALAMREGCRILEER